MERLEDIVGIIIGFFLNRALLPGTGLFPETCKTMTAAF
jgi:hypothetical protein